MRRSTDIDTRTAAIDRLVRAGVGAMPDPSSVAEQHFGLISVALASEQGRIQRTTTAPGRRVSRRRYVVVGAMAAFIAVPSLAFAGALPDPVQRVASNVAAAVGIELPSPADDLDGLRGGSNDGNPDGRRSEDAPAVGEDRGRVNGSQPGKPENGEQRGNRFGQVPEGPDQGKAGQPPQAKPDPPATPSPAKPKTPKPATPPAATPAPAPPAPATSAPATSEPDAPQPPAAPAAGGGNRDGGGKGR